MHSVRSSAALSVGVMLAMSASFGQTPARVRGTVTSIDEGTLTVNERDGRVFKLKTGLHTSYAYVIPSNLQAIRVGTFVGSAVKGPLSSMVAVELAIIPENMQAGRISLYAWDPLADPTTLPASSIIPTNMTNGLVSRVSKVSPAASSMRKASGTISGKKTGSRNLTLSVTYDNGSKSFQIVVPSNAPIVRYVLSDRSALAIGSSVMIKTKPGDEAGLVTIGKGVSPPM